MSLILSSHCATAAEFGGPSFASATQTISPCSLEILRADRNLGTTQALPRQPLGVAGGRSLLPAMLNVFSSPAGKILFRRSHIRDVAVKRLIPIDEYCKVSWDASTIFPRGCSVCFPFWVPSVHGKVGNKIEQNIKFPILLWNQPKSTFSSCVVLPWACMSQSTFNPHS